MEHDVAEKLKTAVERRNELKASVLAWMDSEAREMRFRTNSQAPMWGDYELAEDEVSRLTNEFAAS